MMYNTLSKNLFSAYKKNLETSYKMGQKVFNTLMNPQKNKAHATASLTKDDQTPLPFFMKQARAYNKLAFAIMASFLSSGLSAKGLNLEDTQSTKTSSIIPAVPLSKEQMDYLKKISSTYSDPKKLEDVINKASKSSSSKSGPSKLIDLTSDEKFVTSVIQSLEESLSSDQIKQRMVDLFSRLKDVWKDDQKLKKGSWEWVLSNTKKVAASYIDIQFTMMKTSWSVGFSLIKGMAPELYKAGRTSLMTLLPIILQNK